MEVVIVASRDDIGDARGVDHRRGRDGPARARARRRHGLVAAARCTGHWRGASRRGSTCRACARSPSTSTSGSTPRTRQLPLGGRSGGRRAARPRPRRGWRVPDGCAADLRAACGAFEEQIAAAGGIDIQLLGIGADGHIGFNEPSSSLTSRTRIKTLTEQTRRDNARFFDAPTTCRMHCVTQGLGRSWRRGTCCWWPLARRKAEAVAAAVEGPLSANCPASVIHWHPHATVVRRRGRGRPAQARRLLPAHPRQQAHWQPF